MPDREEQIRELEALAEAGTADSEQLKQLGDLYLLEYEEKKTPEFLLKAIGVLRRASEKNPDSPRILANLGLALFLADEREEAKEVLKKVLLYPSVDPKPHFTARYLLGKIALQEEAYRDAVAHLREALILEPTYLEARIDYGVALARSGRFRDAKREFEEVLRMDPGNAIAQENLRVIEEWERGEE